MTEQILAALPDVRTTAEHPFTKPVYDKIDSFLEPEDRTDQFHRLDALSPEQITQARQMYWNEVWDVVGPDARASGATIVDEFPLRILDVALISRIFPGAKVVVVIRDPRDCCLSCFFQDFSLNAAMARFLELSEIGRTYSHVMGFWLDIRQKTAIEWLEVRYEDLVGDFEPNARRLVEFVDRPWTDSVLSFHKKAAKRAIATPSHLAVTREVNTRAVGRWAHYESHLAPLIPNLRPCLEAFGYEE